MKEKKEEKQASPKELSQCSFGEAVMKEKKEEKKIACLCRRSLQNQFAFLASPSGKIILLTKKKITIEMPPFSTVVPML